MRAPNTLTFQVRLSLASAGLSAIVFLGCATTRYPPLPGPTAEDVRIENRENLNDLSIGMTREEILELMGTETVQTYRHARDHRAFVWGKGRTWMYAPVAYWQIPQPFRTEATRGSDGARIEILYYYTDLRRKDGVVTDRELTPLVLEADRLVGWGWAFVEPKVEAHGHLPGCPSCAHHPGP
jgi:hypothetical protein